MNYLKLYYVVILSYFILSCSENDEPGKQEPQLTFSDSIAGVWVVSEVKLDDNQRDEWFDFELEIKMNSDTSGLFHTTGLPQIDTTLLSETELIRWNNFWKPTMSWNRSPYQAHELIREDTLDLTALFYDSLSTMQLIFFYQIDDPCEPTDTTGCPLTFSGDWEYTLNRKE